MATKGYIGNPSGKAERIDKCYIGGENCAKNLLTNGALSSNTSGWDMQPTTNYSQTFVDNALRITQKSFAGVGKMFANYQTLENPIGGASAEERRLVMFCAKVRGSKSNANGVPLIYTHAYLNGTTEVARFDITADINGVSGEDLSDGEWHLLAGIYPTYNPDTGNSYEFFRVAFGIHSVESASQTAVGDIMDIKDFCVIDVTDAYGSGNEPSPEWCYANLSDCVEKLEVDGGRLVDRLVNKIYIGDENGLAKLVYEEVTS